MKRLTLILLSILICHCGSSSSSSAPDGIDSADTSTSGTSAVKTTTGMPISANDQYKDIYTIEDELVETDDTMTSGEYYKIINMGSYHKPLTIELYLDGLVGLDVSTGNNDENTIDPKLLVVDMDQTNINPDDPDKVKLEIIYSDDDSGGLHNAYLKFTTEPNKQYAIFVTTYDSSDTGKWQLLYNLRESHKDEDLLNYGAEEDSEDSDSDDSSGYESRTCYSKTCAQCYRWSTVDCACVIRLDYGYCMENNFDTQ